MSDGQTKTTGAPDLERVSTGHDRADEVLHGGFPAHSINIIMGTPGTGKTILAQQLLFHNAADDRPVVYLSTLSEPLQKVLSYLQRFHFYDEEKMLGSVVYEDVGAEILEHGAGYLNEHIETLIRERRPRLLVVDSYKAVHDLAGSRQEMRRLSAQLGGLLSAYDITTFLIGEYVSEEVSEYPEFAVADGVVQLERRGTEKRDERFLRVLKLRGSGYAEGSHAFTISRDGLHVYPRLVTPPTAAHYQAPSGRLGTGVDGLDPVVGGGLPRSSTTLVLGTAGTGKTTLGLSFVLEGVRSGEPALFFNLQENPVQLGESLRRFGIDVEDYVERGLHLRYLSSVELRIDSMVVELFRMIRDEGIRRVVIDGLADLRLAATSGERFHDYVYSMVQQFKANGVTALLTLEGEHEPEFGEERRFRLSALCDGLIYLDIDLDRDSPQRLLRVIKARASEHPLDARPFAITGDGMRMEADDESER